MYLYPPDVESSGEISSLVQDKLNPQVSSPSPSCPSIFFLSFSPVSGVWGTCTYMYICTDFPLLYVIVCLGYGWVGYFTFLSLLFT